MIIQFGIPVGGGLVLLLFVTVFGTLPALAIYWDASRREADSPLLWAVAMFFAAWTLLGIVMVGLLYYVFVVRE